MAGHENDDSGDVCIDEHSGLSTFIVRVWQPVRGERYRCRGWVEEAGGDAKAAFQGLDKLEDIIADLLARRLRKTT